METVINIQEAKTHLSRIVEDVLGGAEVVLAKAGKPLVRLIPYKASKAPRVGGQLLGQVVEAPDCWAADDDLLGDAPLVAATPLSYAAQLKNLRRSETEDKLAESL
jgi:prevent-host-death family protein